MNTVTMKLGLRVSRLLSIVGFQLMMVQATEETVGADGWERRKAVGKPSFALAFKG